MGTHEILQIIGDCLMAIGVTLGGHHTLKSHLKDKQNKIKMSKKDKKELKLRQKLEKLNTVNN
ncbi:hypothetical protein [Spiroplasma endosymbiont of Virgichneumon dumeticola]|uniref:hypothetical protein n=1 Tax=Spiroplasma endosymbiont of Virgichneumon dumeticola TaxID=3139323 RepID=UPI0035C8DE5B